MKIHIENKTGASFMTRITTEDGTPLQWVGGLTLEPMTRDNIVAVHLTWLCPTFDLMAHVAQADLQASLDTIAAHRHLLDLQEAEVRRLLDPPKEAPLHA